MHLLSNWERISAFVTLMLILVNASPLQVPLHTRIQVPIDAAPEEDETAEVVNYKELLQEIKKKRIEEIKRTLLEKLRLEKPPNVSKFMQDIPEPFMERHADGLHQVEEYEEYFAETEMVAFFAQKIHACGNVDNSVCFTISFNSNFDRDSILSARLMVRYIPLFDEDSPLSYTLRLFDVSSSKQYVQHAFTREEVQWTKFPITSHLQRVFASSSKNVSVTYQVSCHDCPDLLYELSTHTPYIEIVPSNKGNHRTKRSINYCNERSVSCCKARFYVSFEEIGWDNWVLTPKGYYANDCYGTCTGQPRPPAFQHSGVLQRSPHVRRTPCCTPSKLSGLDMCYVLDDGRVQCSLVPDMIVDNCGCA